MRICSICRLVGRANVGTSVATVTRLTSRPRNPAPIPMLVRPGLLISYLRSRRQEQAFLVANRRKQGDREINRFPRVRCRKANRPARRGATGW
jgi:hypothetical protein